MRLKKSLLPVLCLVLLLSIGSVLVQAEPKSDSPPYTCTAPEAVQGYLHHLADGDPFTTVTLYRGESLRLALTESDRSAGLWIDFFERPAGLKVTCLNAADEPIDEQIWKPGEYRAAYPFPVAPVDSVLLEATERELVLSELEVVTKDFTPPFLAAGEAADLLLILNEPGDELTRLGGLLPLLAGEQNLDTQVVYLTRADGYRTHQCLDALRGLGVRRQPIFYDGNSTDASNDDAVFRALGARETLLKRLVTLIRTAQPKLLVTLDPKKENERFSDGTVARLALDAATAAQDAAYAPELPPHTLLKVYAVREEGETVVSFDTPLYALEASTAYEIATTQYARYCEERIFGRALPSSLAFSLEQTEVGADETNDDLLEHLPKEALLAYRTPAPPPTPTPTASPVPTATAVRTDSPVPVQEEAPIEAKPLEARGIYVGIGIVAGGLLLYGLKRKREGKPWLLWTILPPIFGTALTVLGLTGTVFPVRQAEALPTPSAVASPILTDTPSPVPTDTPTPTPTALPTPTPDPEAGYYLDAPGEVYELDFDTGHWWYKSDTLSIDVVRVNTTYRHENDPLVYYVADIRMRSDRSAFRSGLRRYTAPWRYARLDKAVLAITGDNFIEAEKELKGCLIRHGRLYSDYGRADTLIVEPDGMTLSIAHPNTFSGRELLDRGVRNTFSFGPTLVEDGKPSDSMANSRIKHPNPRCGIGMVAPGHWIAIVSDGRQYGYSASITLESFADMFLERGCTLAYNLDGGASAGIVFMGEALNQHASGDSGDTQRSWTDSLMFGYSESVPSPDQPTRYIGYHYD